MHGDIGAAAHGDADIRGGQGRGVIDAVADHGDDAALLQFADRGGLVRRQHFGMHIADTQGFGDHPGAAAVVAGQQVAADMARLQLLDGLPGTWLEGVAEGEQGQHPWLWTLLDQPGQGAALGLPGARRCLQGSGRQAAFVQQAAVAQGQGTTVEFSGDTASGQ